MDRRQVLAALGSGFLAGCLSPFGGRSSTDAPTNESGTATRTPTEIRTSTDSNRTPADSPTETPTATESPTQTESPTSTECGTPTASCIGDGGERLFIGDSIRTSNWQFAVNSVEITETYKLDGEQKQREVPDGEQLVIVTIRITNTGSDRDTWWFDSGFELVGPGCQTTGWIYQVPGSIEPISDIQRIGHIDQYNPQVGYKLDPGETGTMWYTALTADTISRSNIEIDSAFSDSDKSVHWVPASASCGFFGRVGTNPRNSNSR